MRSLRICRARMLGPIVVVVIVLGLAGPATAVHSPAPAPARAVVLVAHPTHDQPVLLHRPNLVRRLNLVLRLVNRARSHSRTCGDDRFPAVRALRRNTRLDRAARRHARDMARHNYFSHTGRNGSDPGDRMNKARYHWSSYGENIAAGYTGPRSVVRAWLGSPGHCRNLMGDFGDIGLGFAFDLTSDYGVYWVQDFGTR